MWACASPPPRNQLMKSCCDAGPDVPVDQRDANSVCSREPGVELEQSLLQLCTVSVHARRHAADVKRVRQPNQRRTEAHLPRSGRFDGRFHAESKSPRRLVKIVVVIKRAVACRRRGARPGVERLGVVRGASEVQRRRRFCGAQTQPAHRFGDGAVDRRWNAS